MGVRPEDRDTAIRLSESLESFEDRLRVVKDGDGRIELQGRVSANLGVMPAVLAVPGDANHMLGEDAAKTRIGEGPRPLLRPNPPRGLLLCELKSRRVGTHNTKSNEPHERPGGHRPAHERKEGVC